MRCSQNRCRTELTEKEVEIQTECAREGYPDMPVSKMNLWCRLHNTCECWPKIKEAMEELPK
jgi:hypothetical protein